MSPTLRQPLPSLATIARKQPAFDAFTAMYALMEATGISDTHLVSSHRRHPADIWPA